MAQVFRRTHYGRRKETDMSAWWIRYRINGRERRERIGPSKRQAEKVLAQRVAALADGKKPPPSRAGSQRFSEFAKEYFEAHGQHLRSARNVSLTIGLWKRHFGPRCRLADINVRKIEAYRSKRIAEGTSRATVNRNVAILRRMLNVACEWDLITENPARKIKAFTEGGGRLRFLSKVEAQSLIEACRRSRNELLAPLVELALATGARRGELLGLRWTDVDFDARALSFPRTKNSERRDLPLSKWALATLRSLHRTTGNSKHVFSRNGKPVHDFRSAWDAALKRAGIADFVFHSTRHTFASWAVQAGMDLYRLQRLLGHKSEAMVRRYAHLRPKDLRDAVELVSVDMGTEEAE